jgi:Ca-activated chloride channel family protein
MSEDERVIGWRKSQNGQPMTTSLTPEGERQLEEIAAATPDGELIRAEQGSTGITTLTEKLRKEMTSELTERVEHVFAYVYYYPLGLALFLLLLELVISEAPRRLFVRRVPPPPKARLGARKPLERPLEEGAQVGS